MEVQGTSEKSSHLQWCQENQKKDTWEPLSHWMDSQLIKQTQERGQTVITRSVQWVCHAINKSSSICVFSTSIFRPQNYLAYACCMKPGCSEMIQSVSPHRAARNTSLLHHSILTTYCHTDTMLTIVLLTSPLMCCILSGVGLHAEIRELNFVTTGLKSKFGVNPQFFSHEQCLYITRFARL